MAVEEEGVADASSSMLVAEAVTTVGVGASMEMAEVVWEAGVAVTGVTEVAIIEDVAGIKGAR